MKNKKTIISLCCCLGTVGVLFANSVNGRAPMRKSTQTVEITLSEAFDIFLKGEDVAEQDTSRHRNKNVALPEFSVTGVRGVKAIGLSNLKQESSFRGSNGDKIAVFIPHPSSASLYKVEGIIVTLRKPGRAIPAFKEGNLRLSICSAIDNDHPPGPSMLTRDYVVTPKQAANSRDNRVEVLLATPIDLPTQGIFVVAEWAAIPANTSTNNSASLAANLSLQESYTWTSVGDFKYTWQREGSVNSLSKLIFLGKTFNSLIGIKVKEVE